MNGTLRAFTANPVQPYKHSLRKRVLDPAYMNGALSMRAGGK